jgi:hypothetical protein
MTEIDTPQLAQRIRVIRLPDPGELEELSLDYFRVGQTYVVPTQLAMLVILSGIAELVDTSRARAEAADFGQPRFP